jgi:hypothetical protein
MGGDPPSRPAPVSAEGAAHDSAIDRDTQLLEAADMPLTPVPANAAYSRRAGTARRRSVPALRKWAYR